MREIRTSGSMRGCRKRANIAPRLHPTLPAPPIPKMFLFRFFSSLGGQETTTETEPPNNKEEVIL